MHIKPIPHIIYTLHEFHNLDDDLKHFDIKEKSAISVYNDTERHIFIQLDQIDYAGDLIDTLVHELLHIKDKKARHGKKFQERVNDIIMSS